MLNARAQMNLGRAVHGAEDDALAPTRLVAVGGASRNREQPYQRTASQTRRAISGHGTDTDTDARRDRSRSAAADVLSETIECAGLARETVARMLGVSRQLVDRKVASGGMTVADVLDLIDGCPDAGEALVRRLQERVDLRRGVRCPAPEMLPRICLYVVGVLGELCTEVAVCVGQADGRRLLGVCGMLHAQIARLESCVRGMT